MSPLLWIGQTLGFLTLFVVLGLWRQVAQIAGTLIGGSVTWRAISYACAAQAAARFFHGLSGVIDPQLSVSLAWVHSERLGLFEALCGAFSLLCLPLIYPLLVTPLAPKTGLQKARLLSCLIILLLAIAAFFSGRSAAVLLDTVSAVLFLSTAAYVFWLGQRFSVRKVKLAALAFALASLGFAASALSGHPLGGALACSFIGLASLGLLHSRAQEICEGRLPGVSWQRGLLAWALAEGLLLAVGPSLIALAKTPDHNFALFAHTIGCLVAMIALGMHFRGLNLSVARFLDQLGSQRAREMLAGVDAAVFLIDHNGRVLDCSERALSLASCRLDQLQGESVWSALGIPASELAFFEALDGRGRHFEIASRPLGPVQRRLFAITARDVSAQKNAESQLERLAREDELTGLPNRRAALSLIDSLSRESPDAPFALLFLDLDHFKQVNDTLGHSAGDELLREISCFLSDAARSFNAWAARLGGDEFLIFLPDGTDQRCHALAGALFEAIATSPLAKAGSIGVSIGAARYPRDGRGSADLSHKADAAMYEAKVSGRGRLCFFGEIIERRLKRRAQVEAFLRDALRSCEGSGLALWLQPICSLNGVFANEAEALIRAPGLPGLEARELIEVAEQSGLILPLGRWALAEAARLRDFSGCVGPEVSLSLNVSPKQFDDPEFWALFTQLSSERSGFAQSVTLEVTESALNADTNQSAELLRQAKARGAKLALDDFGSGGSSFSMLTRIPLDKVKLDKSLIDQAPGDPGACKITQAALAMCSALGFEVVCEGVETAEQAAWLNAQGVSRAQGYLFARPMAPEDFWIYCSNARQNGAL